MVGPIRLPCTVAGWGGPGKSRPAGTPHCSQLGAGPFSEGGFELRVSVSVTRGEVCWLQLREHTVQLLNGIRLQQPSRVTR